MMSNHNINPIFESCEKIDDYVYKIPKSFRKGMNVDGIIFADKDLIVKAEEDRALEQVINVAFLPGIVRASFAMPDIHWGYGFPIGGVAATDVTGEAGGVISPGGVGFDISCGVRMLKTNLKFEEVSKMLEEIMYEIARNVPKGVGSRGKIKAMGKKMEKLLTEGAKWAVKNGYGWEEDLRRIEEEGTMPGANPDKVSPRVFERGKDQAGTLGAGNHFIEIQEVGEVFDEKTASAFGVFQGQLVVMIHSGSRGPGHQICSDYIKIMDKAVHKYGYKLPDRQLACAPLNSKEGRDYYEAMACAVNYALANRQCLAHWVRESFEKILRKSAKSLGMELLYDVSHNVAKVEEHKINGKTRKLCVHRKGATRAFGPGNPLIT
ncbi:MAG: RtcB family protein, partial [Actinomycetia bacterium]|nr:RtcB family protein [Actinomycetes bacterium]